MDRLGDLSVAERFPIAFWNAGDRRLHRRVLIRANRENLAGHFAPVEDRRLIGRAVRANGHDPFALWHVAFAGLQKLEVPCRRRGVAFAKLMADHDAKFRDMPDHRHVALLALVGVMGLVLFRDDLRCVDIERVVDAFVAQQQTPKDAAVYVLQPDQATALFRADATQPITGRVAARHFIQEEERAALRHGAIHANPPMSVRRQRASGPAARHEPKGCSPPRCRAPAVHGRSGRQPQTAARYSPNSASPPCAVNDSSVPASWNDNTVCEDPTAPSR